MSHTFPVYQLNKSQIVPLPGVLYKLTFDAKDGTKILSYFSSRPEFKNILLSSISLVSLSSVSYISDAAVESSKQFEANNTPYITMFMCLLPQNGADVATLCKISAIATTDSAVTLTFQALARAHVTTPVLNSKDIYESIVDVEMGTISLDSSFKQKFEDLLHKVETFRGRYLTSKLLKLSPLANSLHSQLHSADFRKSVRVLQRHEINSKLLDLAIAVLPTTNGSKLKFLAERDPKLRVDLFWNICNKFTSLLDSLYESTEYVEQYYAGASSYEKAKLVSNQLRSLRAFTEDFKKPGKSKAIEDDNADSLDTFMEDILNKNIHPDGVKMLSKDFKRLKSMNQQNAEYQVLRNYFDIVLDIPFGKYVSHSLIDITTANKQLNDDHYGLWHVKKRLTQYLSVLKLQETLNHSSQLVVGAGNTGESLRSPILLLVGPPGVGKTSLAQSVAKALGRNFQRISLGGIHNESDIRGHRRTYVGSMVGMIINALRKSQSMNPLILLDEIDKVLSGGAGGNGRINGDPGAALLEVLDPEQNSTFMDHYLGFPVDLSQVLFFCTANELYNISEPLRDRMEIIEIAGYTPEEKIEIGRRYLLPKQLKMNGLNRIDAKINITQPAWEQIVLEYTREAGVRNLDRQVSSIVRGKVVEYIDDTKFKDNVEVEDLIKYIGLPLHPISKEIIARPKFAEPFGVVNGLSYNSDGSGSVMVFETINVGPVKNGPVVKTTGRLGTVLEESIKIGVSYVKSILSKQIRQTTNFNESEIHLHVPMGGVSKDGPSAGIAIALALLSNALGKSVDPTIAMTGEITLRGKVLPIGGISEKLHGASLYGIKKVLVPKSNRKDLLETLYDENLSSALHDESLPELQLLKVKLDLDVHYVDDFWDVIKNVWPDSDLLDQATNTASLL